MTAVVLDTHQRDAHRVPRDRLIAELAARQDGVVSDEQLRRVGLGRGAIAGRLRTGRLHRVFPGAYAVGHARISPAARARAAVMSYGDGASLSHRSAAGLWGLRRDGGTRIDVTVVGKGRRERPGVRLHRVRRMDPSCVTLIDGIPVTTVARTLLDLAEVVGADHLHRAVEEAERLRLFDLGAIKRTIGSARGRHGVRPLREVIESMGGPPPITRSELERRFLDLCRRHAIPSPLANVVVAGHEVDMHWPEAGLVIELDGYGSHGTRAAFERDRARDADLLLAGQRVLRITWRRLHDRPQEVAATLLSLGPTGYR